MRSNARTDAHLMKVRDAQPPDGDLALPGRGDRRGRRDSRRRRDRTRRASPRRAWSATRSRTCAFPARRSPGRTATTGKPDRIVSRARRSCSRGRSGRPRSTTSSAVPTWPAISAASSSRPGACWRGYHKPIMLAGGVGNISAAHSAEARPWPRGRCWCSWAVPGMLIGMGGGAASTMAPAPTPRTSTSIRCSAATPRSSAARRK